MADPSTATIRVCREFLHYANVWGMRVVDDAAETATLAPIVRMGPPLRMFFVGETRTLSGADSFVQSPYEPVGSYAWTATGATVTGGTTSSTITLRYDTPGTYELALAVNGGSASKRFIQVVNRPGVGEANTQAITDYTRSPISGSLPDRGWAGHRVSVDLVGDYGDTFAKYGLLVVIRQDEYEGTSLDNLTLTASGEVFCGFITEPGLEIIDGGAANRVTFTAATIEALLADGLDGDDHVFVDTAIGESDDLVDVFGVLGYDPSISDAHLINRLTPLKMANHLVDWHYWVDISGTLYRLGSLIDRIVPWWMADPALFRIHVHNIPRGDLKRAIENLLPARINEMYTNRLSQVAITLSHAAQAVFTGATQDAVVDSIVPGRCYRFVPIAGQGNRVRQVKIEQSPSQMADAEEEPLIALFPATPRASGTLLQPSLPFQFTTQDAADEVAEALDTDANLTAGFECTIAGSTFDLFNLATVTLDVSVFDWTAKRFYCVSADADRPNADHAGGAHSRHRFREAPA